MPHPGLLRPEPLPLWQALLTCASAGDAQTLKGRSGQYLWGLLVRTRRCHVAQLCPTLCDPMDCSLPGSEEPLSPWNFPGKSTGVGCHFLLQGIFPTQESNPSLLHGSQILYQMSFEGIPACGI